MGRESVPVWHPSGMLVWCGFLPVVSSRCSSTTGYILGTLRVRGRGDYEADDCHGARGTLRVLGRGGGFSPRGNVSGAFSVASRS